MATFALFYKRADYALIAAEAQNPGLTAQERQTANRYWQGGLNAWSSAPQAPDAQACVEIPFDPTGQPSYADKVVTDLGNGRWRVCDPDIRICVISGNQVSKQGLIDFLRLIGGKYPGALYMLAIADDISATAIEPWTG